MLKVKQREGNAAADVAITTDLPSQEVKTTRKRADIQRVDEVSSGSDIEEGASEGETEEEGLEEEIAKPAHFKEFVDYLSGAKVFVGTYTFLLTVEVLGCKSIQIMGFLLAILAGTVCNMLRILQFVFFKKFVSNTRVPDTLQGFRARPISAAAGKASTIISALALYTLEKKVCTPAVLWITLANILGAVFMVLLHEVRGHDPDIVLAEETRKKKARSEQV
ncbi:hypothetical protein D9619_010148 [Psilocybe cf. subviscida]|uniref:Uncharacterized protein n=1 Tax=Psilocybe cf. subviscida TaxID=2480587 RepID=A0A8H5ASC9_9AGAR|nr:hypothetical protein D9619_010148 [Psilocybe cf. subviscida]